MTLSNSLCTMLLCCLNIVCQSQNLSSLDIIKKSINYHDPEGILMKKDITFNFTQSGPDGSERKSTVSFNVKKETFQSAKIIDDNIINSFYDKGKVAILFNGKKDFSKETAK